MSDVCPGLHDRPTLADRNHLTRGEVNFFLNRDIPKLGASDPKDFILKVLVDWERGDSKSSEDITCCLDFWAGEVFDCTSLCDHLMLCDSYCDWLSQVD